MILTRAANRRYAVKVELGGGCCPRKTLLPTIQLEGVNEDELAHRRFPEIRGAQTFFTATVLRDGVRPFKTL
jgi:hypothetical protein